MLRTFFCYILGTIPKTPKLRFWKTKTRICEDLLGVRRRYKGSKTVFADQGWFEIRKTNLPHNLTTFKETGNWLQLIKNHSEETPKLALSNKNITRFEKKLEHSLRISTQRLSLEFKLSQPSVWRILRKELKKRAPPHCGKDSLARLDTVRRQNYLSKSWLCMAPLLPKSEYWGFIPLGVSQKPSIHWPCTENCRAAKRKYHEGS